MAGADGDDSLYPIAVLIDELRNEDVQVGTLLSCLIVTSCFAAKLSHFVVFLSRASDYQRAELCYAT